MDKITLEVDDSIAVIYRNLLPENKQQLNEVVSLILKMTVNNAPLPDSKKTLHQMGYKSIAEGIASELSEGYQQGLLENFGQK